MKYHILILSILNILFINFLNAQNADCYSAKELCYAGIYHFGPQEGPGRHLMEVGGLECYNGYYPETISIWLKWAVKNKGILAFDIVPSRRYQDLDFVLYKLEGSFGDCNKKKPIRCMVSGENLGTNEEYTSLPCKGRTGLRQKANDTDESAGCSELDDNYLDAVNCNPGDQYLLFINNFDNNEEFTLEFTGDVEFKTPNREILIQNYDKLNNTFELCSNNILSKNREYESVWYLTPGCTPSTFTGEGPQMISISDTVEQVTIEYISTNESCNWNKTIYIDNPFLNSTVDLDNNSNIDIYPIPTKDLLHININDEDVRRYSIQIIDVLGQINTYSIENNNEIQTIDLRMYTSGVYFISIRYGEVIYNTKIEKI